MATKAIAGGQVRHFAGTIGGATVVLSLPPDMIMAVQAIMNQVGVVPEAQAGIGGLLIAGASFMSLRSKRKAEAQEKPKEG